MVYLNGSPDVIEAAVAQSVCRRYQVYGLWYTPGLTKDHGYPTTGAEKW